MDLGLKGKNAAISGGSQGLGLAIAQGLADEGCNIAIAARGEERLNQAVADLEARGVKAIGIQADLMSPEGCKKFVDEAAAGLGGLDILVNNVGGMTPGDIESITDEQWDELNNRNMMSYVRCARSAIPHLKESSQGRILNVSGLSGKQYTPGAASTTLANTAIHGLTKMLAGDLGPHGITCNSICPGIVNTEGWGPRAEMMAKFRGTTADQVRQTFSDYTMLGRWGEPEEIGKAAAFLVSGANSYMTGTTVEVCGGWGRYI